MRLLREYDVDIISAYRFDRTGEGSLRAIYTFVYNGLIKALFGVKVRDIDCAFKLLPKSFLDAIELKSEGAMISAELLAKAKYRGLRVAETPVSHFPRTAGAPTGANFKVILKAFRELFALHGGIRRDAGSNPAPRTAAVRS